MQQIALLKMAIKPLEARVLQLVLIIVSTTEASEGNLEAVLIIMMYSGFFLGRPKQYEDLEHETNIALLPIIYS